MPSSTADFSSMNLSAVLAEYLAERDTSRLYQATLRRTVRKLEMYGIKNPCQLQPERINHFLATLPLSPVSRSNIRRELLTVWRYAYERGITDTPPARVRKITVPRKPVRAWSLKTLESLIVIAEKDKTAVSWRCPEIRRCDVIPVWIVLGYDSGLRFSDIHSLTLRDFHNGCVMVTAQKTGKVTVRKLSDHCQLAVARLFTYSPDETLFKWFLPRRRAFVMWNDFLRANGIDGSSRWLRRSGATYVENKQPGGATRFLGHSNPLLAWMSYLDQTLLDMPDGPPPIR